MKFKPSPNSLLLLVAVLMGLTAAWLMNRAFEQRMAQIDEQARSGQDMVEVIVANRDLNSGEALSAEGLAVRLIPRQYAHEGAVSPANFSHIENARLHTSVRRGETLLLAHVSGLGQRVFSTVLKKGMRAVTLEVDDVSSTSGLLRPGDRVDLIYLVKPSGREMVVSERVAFPLMSNVLVMATGQTLTPQEAKGNSRRYTHVTLEVSPEDAQRILLAKSTGELTAVLRSVDDAQPAAASVLTPEALLPKSVKRADPTGLVPLPNFGSPSGIEFLIGGGGSALPAAFVKGG